MPEDRVVPKGEDLRRAVRWLAERGVRSAEAIAEASRLFDLSPLDEEFLLRHLREASPPPADTGR